MNRQVQFNNPLPDWCSDIDLFAPVYRFIQNVRLESHPNIAGVPKHTSPNFSYSEHPAVYENRSVDVLNTPIGQAAMFEYHHITNERSVRCVVQSVVSFRRDRYDSSSVIYLHVSFWDMKAKIGHTIVFRNPAFDQLVDWQHHYTKYEFDGGLTDTELVQGYMDEAVCLLIGSAQEYAQERINEARRTYNDFRNMITNVVKQELSGISDQFSRVNT